jgi:hypothetical protein
MTNMQETVHKVEEFMTKGALLTVGPETPLDTGKSCLVLCPVLTC